MRNYRVMSIFQFPFEELPRVPVTATVLRESEPSSDFLLEVKDSATGQVLALYTPDSGAVQWFERQNIFREVLAQAYEFTEPRMGVMRWPTISETATHLSFNITEGEGGSQVPTVPARVDAAAAVAGARAAREVVVVEQMDDGQWRVAGQGSTVPNAMAELELEVTTSGTLYAMSIDLYGTRFVPLSPVQVGDLIRPTRFAGWLYQITEAGQLPAAEPEWWPQAGDNPSRPVGTGRAVAVRYFRPSAFGPVTVEMI